MPIKVTNIKNADNTKNWWDVKNWNSPAFLVVMHNGTTILEIYLAANTMNIRPSDLTSAIYSSELKTDVHTCTHKIYMQNFSVVSFISPNSEPDLDILQ